MAPPTYHGSTHLPLQLRAAAAPAALRAVERRPHAQVDLTLTLTLTANPDPNFSSNPNPNPNPNPNLMRSHCGAAAWRGGQAAPSVVKRAARAMGVGEDGEP